MKKYLLYFNERFPIPGVILYSGSMYWVSYSFANLFAQRTNWFVIDMILGMVLFFLVLLHLRLFDEHKDFDKDVIAYPERMLSRGVITLLDLRKILYPVLIIEAAISLYLGVIQFAAWLLILIWTLLMLKEFFVPQFLNKRIGLYLISHQLLVPIMLFFTLTQRLSGISFGSHEITSIILLFIGSTCLTVTYEIGRKTWSKDRENEHADSYTREWGVARTISITLVIALVGTMIFTYIMSIFEISIIYIAINILLLAVLSIIEVLFYKQQSINNSKRVELAGAVFMLVTFINSSVAFSLYFL